MVAQEAARLICEHGLDDFRAAKQKAAEKLGLTNYGALPDNRQIEAAVAERNRIFAADIHQSPLAQIRRSAISIMLDLECFRPRLVGSVLSGNITEHSGIELHLFTDTSESVGMHLNEHGFSHSSAFKRLKFRKNIIEQFPAHRFYVDDFSVEATIFPEQKLKQAPLSPLDGRPMQRGKIRDLELLENGA